MEDRDEATTLLREIRDLQREQVEEYRRVTRRSLELQEKAVARQEQIGKTYRVVLVASAVLVLGIIILVVYLLANILPRIR